MAASLQRELDGVPKNRAASSAADEHRNRMALLNSIGRGSP
jgi:hypothetical protein